MLLMGPCVQGRTGGREELCFVDIAAYMSVFVIGWLIAKEWQASDLVLEHEPHDAVYANEPLATPSQDVQRCTMSMGAPKPTILCTISFNDILVSIAHWRSPSMN